MVKLFGRCESKSGIALFDRLVEKVKIQTPYREAGDVYWIVDNGSAYWGAKCVMSLQGKYSDLALIHGSVPRSWLN
jgi:hypothetical protein